VSSHPSRRPILRDTLPGVEPERTNIGTASLPAVSLQNAPPEISTRRGVLLQLQDPPRSPATFFKQHRLPGVAVLPIHAIPTPPSSVPSSSWGSAPAPPPDARLLGLPHRMQVHGPTSSSHPGVEPERTNTASLPAVSQESAPPEISTKRGVLHQLQDPPRSPATLFTEHRLPSVTVFPIPAMPTPPSSSSWIPVSAPPTDPRLLPPSWDSPSAPPPPYHMQGYGPTSSSHPGVEPKRTTIGTASLPAVSQESAPPKISTEQGTLFRLKNPPRSPATSFRGSPTSFTEHRFPDVTVPPIPAMPTPPSSAPVQLLGLPYQDSVPIWRLGRHSTALPAPEVSKVSQAQSQETPTPSNWILQMLGSMPFQTATVTTPIAQVPKPVSRWKGRNKLRRRSRVPKESLEGSHKDISITPDITRRSLYPMLESRPPSPKSIRVEY